MNNVYKCLFKHKILCFGKQSFSYTVFYRKVTKFREKFVSAYGNSNITSWFPGHMYKGTLQLQAKLAVVDCVIEVHDARIPFSGRNPKLHSMLSAIRPHILVLNKCDLADLSSRDEVKRGLQRKNVHNIIYANCKENKQGVQKVLPLAVELIKNSERYNRANSDSFNVMVIGIPNVGKSSLINRLRNIHLNKKSAATVGAIPGVTKTVSEKIKIHDNPKIYLLDTPGIIEPTIENLEVGMKLALCRTLNDHLVGINVIADYLLYWLNKHKNYKYLKFLNLQEPTDNIRILLLHIAKEFHKFKKVRNLDGTISMLPDMLECSTYFVSGFRKGEFGRITLDTNYLS